MFSLPSRRTSLAIGAALAVLAAAGIALASWVAGRGLQAKEGAAAGAPAGAPAGTTGEAKKMKGKKVALPSPDTKGKMTVEAAIERRRSRRDYDGRPLALAQLGQLLWAAQGCTGEGCLRAAPSAGATYPLEMLAVVARGGVAGLGEGVYRYLPEEHAVELALPGDRREALATAALGQECVHTAPVSILFAADRARTAKRYGGRAERYVDMEVGHAAENLYLQAESLGLGTVAVGAFDDKGAAAAAGIESPLVLLYIMPVGNY